MQVSGANPPGHVKCFVFTQLQRHFEAPVLVPSCGWPPRACGDPANRQPDNADGQTEDLGEVDNVVPDDATLGAACALSPVPPVTAPGHEVEKLVLIDARIPVRVKLVPPVRQVLVGLLGTLGHQRQPQEQALELLCARHAIDAEGDSASAARPAARAVPGPAASAQGQPARSTN
jgi:hypothetical protein